jgi:hypothetical protein
MGLFVVLLVGAAGAVAALLFARMLAGTGITFIVPP